jgi:hypothetical protein
MLYSAIISDSELLVIQIQRIPFIMKPSWLNISKKHRIAVPQKLLSMHARRWHVALLDWQHASNRSKKVDVFVCDHQRVAATVASLF